MTKKLDNTRTMTAEGSRIDLDQNSIDFIGIEIVKRVTANHDLSLQEVNIDQIIDTLNKDSITGAASACVCFLALHDKLKRGGEVGNRMLEVITSQLGLHYCAHQKREIVVKKIEKYEAVRKLWDNYNEFPELTDFLDKYCPPSENDSFFDGWVSFLFFHPLK